jgi:MFS family permease
MGTGILISSLLTPKVVPRLGTGILKIGTIIMIIGYGLLVITAHQESNIGFQWSQLLTYIFIIEIGIGFVPVPSINIIISHAKIENVGAASGVLNTMMAVGNAMGIALIGSLFFGMIGTIVVIACLLVDLGSTYEKQHGRAQVRFKMAISASSPK